ncbi:MAG: hypothetical protein IPP91_15740 [Betaproteobacteria bacterium]|nr:hypothetical protein [Betaproteobacteria bacterium]
MNAKRIAVVALALALTACAHDAARHEMAPRRPDWKLPNVQVIGDKYLVVDQEPIIVPSGSRDDIAFVLQHDSDYAFYRDGVVVSAPKGEFDCRVQAGGQRVVCRNRHSNPPTDPKTYKYMIQVARPGAKPITLDPFVVND